MTPFGTAGYAGSSTVSIPDVTDRRGWDVQHREGAYDRSPSRFLEEVSPLLPKGLALDLACGAGANAIYLAENGFEVEALDWSIFALRHLRSRCASVRCVACDLTRYPLPRGRYDVVLCIRYLDRALWPAITAALRTGGALVYETFTERYREQRPDFPIRFCLEEGELKTAFAPALRPERYREGLSPAIASLLAFRESKEDRPATDERSRETRANASHRQSAR